MPCSSQMLFSFKQAKRVSILFLKQVQVMKKLLCLISLFICATTTNANTSVQGKSSNTTQKSEEIKFGKDILATAINYPSFEVEFMAFLQQMRKSRAKKDYNILCELSKMTHEYMVNNIKYSEEFNKNHPNLKYESLLNELTNDNYQNKEGCTGKAYFYN